MKRKLSSLALMFFSMALTLHLTDQAARCSQEIPPSDRTIVAERTLSFLDVMNLPDAGLGAMVECEPAGVRLVTCLPGHAASEAGLRVGDRITVIDGESARGCNQAWAISKLRGKIGSSVQLEVERGEGLWQRTFRTSLQRAYIQSEFSVYSRLRDGELTIKVLWLNSSTSEQLVRHLAQVSPDEIDSLILDLSGLSNGDINSVVECASLFLPEGSKVGCLGTDSEWEILESEGFQFTDQLTAVKVGPYTARAGEVFARALINNSDIEVMGEETAGLGTLDGRTIKSRGRQGSVPISNSSAATALPSMETRSDPVFGVGPISLVR